MTASTVGGGARRHRIAPGGRVRRTTTTPTTRTSRRPTTAGTTGEGGGYVGSDRAERRRPATEPRRRCAPGSPPTRHCSIRSTWPTTPTSRSCRSSSRASSRRRPTVEVVNVLADTYEVSDDGLTIDFTLKQGIQFHGGYGEMTMDDVKFSIERSAGLLDDVETTSITAFFTALESVEAIDDYTGRIVLKEPSVTLVEQALPLTGIISRKAYEELGVEGFQRNPIGTGPYAARRSRRRASTSGSMQLHRVRRAGAVRARRAVRRDHLPDHPGGQRGRARLRGR